ncbi:MAG: RNA polymerase sigma factor [Candidatus Kapabacteria bacterium]|nr:RNA polymerase sigma factor [Candidatus Kapabacteria bacterium]
MNTQEITLRATLERYCREQSEEAFRAVYDACKQHIYRLSVHLCGRRDSAKDLSQEIWIKLWKHLCGFRGESKLFSWLYRVGMNVFLDKKNSFVGAALVSGSESRRKAIYKEISASEFLAEMSNEAASTQTNLAPPNGHNPAIVVENVSAQELVEQALMRLSNGERTVFVAKHYHDLTFKEIAEELGTHEGTAKTLHFRALKKMQTLLAAHYAELSDNALSHTASKSISTNA